MDPTPRLAPARSPNEIGDEELVRRVVAGESGLFELLMRRHNQRLYRVLVGTLGDTDEAEDVLQDTWVRAWKSLSGFRGEARVSTWLIRIGLHEAWSRKRRRRRFVLLDNVPEAPLTANAPSPEIRTLTVELRAELERAIAAVPEHFRVVFVMREVEGLSTRETAELLEITPENVKVRLHRARAALRHHLERSLGGAARELFELGGARCDRTVASVLARLASS